MATKKEKEKEKEKGKGKRKRKGGGGRPVRFCSFKGPFRFI
jgi:hypothetical protein